MKLSAPIKSKISDYVFELLRDGVRTRQYKTGKAIEDGARDLFDRDITLFPLIESGFESVRVGASLVFTKPLAHHKIYCDDSLIRRDHSHCIQVPGTEEVYDMGNVHIRYSDSLDAEVLWENRAFMHGHFGEYGGEWYRFSGVCLNTYKHPQDTALSYGFSSGLLSILSFMQYSRYGSHIKGVTES
jgi:hypothetical protein